MATGELSFMKQVADCIVEVTIHYFKKSDKVFFSEIEDLCHLGGVCALNVESTVKVNL